MQESIMRMLAKYSLETPDSATRALREVVQQVVLLGLWRAKFFEKAAFYGGTALRILHGLDRCSEDLDFSLLAPGANFKLGQHSAFLQQELAAFGFTVHVETLDKKVHTSIQSAFVKMETRSQLLVIETPAEIANMVAPGQKLKVRMEVDTDPPPGFSTTMHYLLSPVPFPVRAFSLPDLFAGKMHAVLCRRWKNRVKGRDWHDLVWFAANHPQLHLSHLEQRMRQTGDWTAAEHLTLGSFRSFLAAAVDRLDIAQARRDVGPFLLQPESLAIWSHEFFHAVAERIQAV